MFGLRMNAAMRPLYEEVKRQKLDDIALLDHNLAALADEISFVDGCYLLGRHQSIPPFEQIFRDFLDLTGYECFTNHVHLLDLVPDMPVTGRVGQALAISELLSGRLSRLAPKDSFTFIMSVDEKDCVLRFHKDREGENWVCDDLDVCYSEPVLVFEP